MNEIPSRTDVQPGSEWWVYVRKGAQRAFPVGPFTSKEAVDPWVQPTARYAEEHIDGYAAFYEWGVAHMPNLTGQTGRLNAAVGVTA